ncbi:hypothetical protein R5R35_013882 [Gryllus longicercus]|uniref:Large ribosomal subunit protein uL3m n=1 Tax=Gryllus longicercus TaxID=2509291 RepID=A0AAN9ZAU3_9ORTH
MSTNAVKMATRFGGGLFSSHGKPTNVQLLAQSFQAFKIQTRDIRPGSKPGTRPDSKPKQRFPDWFLKKERVQYNEGLTAENKAFVQEVVEDKFGPPAIIGGIATYKSPLKVEPLVRGEWTEKSRRTGVIARKIGVYPLWFKDGKKVLTSLLQVIDNHVIQYTPPGEFQQARKLEKALWKPNKLGCLLVGAESTDPQKFTKEYCGLFSKSGVMPKKILARFLVTPDAAIQPGTPLLASHFRVGDYVDVRGKTIDRGFQGVMTRWGFSGMPASHGVTKTHRRAGNIGSGGTKARVWKGQKMPGHMGNRWRVLRGLRIWRINTKYNVLYVSGQNIPGETNSMVYIYDTVLPLRKFKEPPPFPTYYTEYEENLPDDIYYSDVHQFSEPSIMFEENK